MNVIATLTQHRDELAAEEASLNATIENAEAALEGVEGELARTNAALSVLDAPAKAPRRRLRK